MYSVFLLVILSLTYSFLCSFTSSTIISSTPVDPPLCWLSSSTYHFSFPSLLFSPPLFPFFHRSVPLQLCLWASDAAMSSEHYKSACSASLALTIYHSSALVCDPPPSPSGFSLDTVSNMHAVCHQLTLNKHPFGWACRDQVCMCVYLWEKVCMYFFFCMCTCLI